MPPKTTYAKSGDVNVAYQVLGEGPPDLIYVWGWLSHLDFMWTDPTITSFVGPMVRPPPPLSLRLVYPRRQRAASRARTAPRGRSVTAGQNCTESGSSSVNR